jgi:aliphatic sulfonates family ABC transporter substrate-binding protein
MRLFKAVALLFALATVATSAAAETPLLRIGYQKIGPLVILKQQHTLEEALKPDGIGVQWVEFQSGPPLMEALNAGGIDVAYAGETPPVFAQAAGVDLVYVGYQPLSGRNAGILVPKDSPIHTVADLKGHSIAFTKGSSAHYLTARNLAKNGLTFADVKPIYLSPSDGAAAFRTGRVDAWAVWDPFFAIAERDPNSNVLTANAPSATNAFFLARRAYATAHEAVIVKFIDQINNAAIWSGAHQEELAQTMTEITGVDLDAQRVAAARGSYTAAFLTPEAIARQQLVADTFFALKIIPGRVDVAAATFVPKSVRADLQGSPQ